MKIIVFYSLLLLSVFAFSQSCNTSKKAIKNVNSNQISEKFDVKLGDSLTIKLSSNASTGHKWELVSKIKPAVIKYKSNKYTNNDKTMSMGSTGTDTWTFNTLKVGKVYILMKYLKSENEIAKEKYFEINVTE